METMKFNQFLTPWCSSELKNRHKLFHVFFKLICNTKLIKYIKLITYVYSFKIEVCIIKISNYCLIFFVLLISNINKIKLIMLFQHFIKIFLVLSFNITRVFTAIFAFKRIDLND